MVDRRATVVDTVLVVALGALSLSLVAGLEDEHGRTAVLVALVVAHVVPLWLRRRAPVGVLATMAVTGVVSVPLGLPVVVLGPGILVAVYTVGTRCPPQLGGRAVAAATLVMAGVVAANGMGASTMTTNALGFAAAWWLGDRSRRASVESEAQRALAAEAARRAASAERVRIARELHDVVAHAMSVIAVQAGTGRFVIDRSPEVAREALSSIETTSRGAMQEMRRLLAVLRDDASAEVDLGPAPGLGDLEALVDGARDAGVATDLTVEGARRPLPAGAELCAYRVVQEALTNVRRHARARRAWVRIRYAPASIDIEVVDDGVGAGTVSGPGHGLVGMRERLALYGGALEAGDLPTGGYRVHASLPVGDDG